MTEHDDILIKNFFSEHKQTIPDGGFTEKVMRQIPIRELRFARIWQSICIIATIMLFIIFKGWNIFSNIFINMFHGILDGQLAHTSWVSLAIGLIVCIIIMVERTLSAD